MPVHRVSRLPAAPDRHAIHGHQTERLWSAPEEHLQVEVGEGGGIQHTPELPLARLHGDRGRRIVRVRHRNVVDGEILCGLAKAGAVVGRVPIAVDQHLGDDRLVL